LKAILISGSKGFVGQNLIKYLMVHLPTWRVFFLLRNKQDEKFITDDKSSNEIYWSDLENGIPNEIDYVIHLAGKAHDLKNVSRPEEYFEVNTVLTERLFDAFLKSNATKFIFLSSVKAAADEVKAILTEDAIPNPQTVYGKSKLAAEVSILRKLEEYTLESSLSKKLYILRPCMIHGEGNKGNLNLLYQMMKKGIPYPLGSFENKRSFLSVENLCFVLKELMESEIESNTFQVADNEALSTNQLIELIAQSINKKPMIWRLPQKGIELLAKFGGILHLPLNPERLQKLTESYVVSNQKLCKALGKELPVKAKVGLLKTLSSFS
jgi:nucleoside-diphosphate-sugar epimerase